MASEQSTERRPRRRPSRPWEASGLLLVGVVVALLLTCCPAVVAVRSWEFVKGNSTSLNSSSSPWIAAAEAASPPLDPTPLRRRRLFATTPGPGIARSSFLVETSGDVCVSQTANQVVYSPNGAYYLSYGTDSNLVVGKSAGGILFSLDTSATWTGIGATATYGWNLCNNCNRRLCLQNDGNTVMYEGGPPGGTMRWGGWIPLSPATAGSYTLWIDDAGNAYVGSPNSPGVVYYYFRSLTGAISAPPAGWPSPPAARWPPEASPSYTNAYCSWPAATQGVSTYAMCTAVCDQTPGCIAVDWNSANCWVITSNTCDFVSGQNGFKIYFPTTASGPYYFLFRSSTTWSPVCATCAHSLLVVGGGGAGGSGTNANGGGGAGGVVTGSFTPGSTSVVYTMTIGGGGTPTYSNNGNGGYGGTTYFSGGGASVKALGGGGGCGASGAPSSGGSGGGNAFFSGYGWCSYDSTKLNQDVCISGMQPFCSSCVSGLNAAASYGRDGGYSGLSFPNSNGKFLNYAGSGGGGATSAGVQAYSVAVGNQGGGPGGAGFTWIDGTTYAGGGGGGAAGDCMAGAYSPGAGGSGGGGGGGVASNCGPNAGVNANFYGGGGGGSSGWQGSTTLGGNGYQGVVKARACSACSACSAACSAGGSWSSPRPPQAPALPLC